MLISRVTTMQLLVEKLLFKTPKLKIERNTIKTSEHTMDFGIFKTTIDTTVVSSTFQQKRMYYIIHNICMCVFWYPNTSNPMIVFQEVKVTTFPKLK